jgi:hypothetical protein
VQALGFADAAAAGIVQGLGHVLLLFGRRHAIEHVDLLLAQFQAGHRLAFLPGQVAEMQVQAELRIQALPGHLLQADGGGHQPRLQVLQ